MTTPTFPPTIHTSQLLSTPIMRTKRAGSLLAVVALATLVACTGPSYEQDYKPGTDFNSSWERYQWRGGQSQIPGVEHQRIQQVAEQALASQGYAKDPDSPQLLLNLSALTRPATSGNRSLGLSIGLPVGRHGSVGVGGAKSLGNERQEGVLILDITHAESRDLIWRGSATGIALKDFNLAREDQLRKALERLLAQFPPESE